MSQLQGCLLAETEVPNRAGLARRPDLFLKGPIPMEWLRCVGALRGDTLKAALLIWHAAGFKGEWSGLKLPPRLWKGWYRDRSTLYRALERLEEAGLIEVDRCRGRSPIVSIKEVPTGL